ncbi:cupredoxin domain-containing protein [Candidatus Magnetominusculus dajiuhuensis]|uniref:cupredoxin domain-containing protein n=1 Tax=Candidatus Magnetominusculus dajiuhuensis TaxID=3137712 RepID=UPI003B438BC6
MKKIRLLQIVSVTMAIVLAYALIPLFSDRLAAESESLQNQQAAQVETIKITAKKYEYSPRKIRLKKGVEVILELTSLDRHHGFKCPGLGLRADIYHGEVTRLRVTPQKAGTYEFHCDSYCGSGHEDMSGDIIVED